MIIYYGAKEYNQRGTWLAFKHRITTICQKYIKIFFFNCLTIFLDLVITSLLQKK